MPFADHRPRGIHEFQYSLEYFILVYDFHGVKLGTLHLNVSFLSPSCSALKRTMKAPRQSSVDCALCNCFLKKSYLPHQVRD